MSSTSSKLLAICYYIQFLFSAIQYLRWAKPAINVKEDQNVPSLIFKYEQTEEYNG